MNLIENTSLLTPRLFGGAQLYDVHIIVPKKFNNGQAIPVNVINEIENRIFPYTDGFKLYEIIGKWKDGKHLYLDNNFEYSILSNENNVQNLKSVAEFVKIECDQKSVFFSVSPTMVWFI